MFTPAMLAFTCLATVLVVRPVVAQIVIGGEPKRPAVEVDLGALEQLAKGVVRDIVPRPAPRPAGAITSTPLAAPRSEPRPLVAAPAVTRPTSPVAAVARPVAPVAPVLTTRLPSPPPSVAQSAASQATSSSAITKSPIAASPVVSAPVASQPAISPPATTTQPAPAPANQIAALAPAPTAPQPVANRPATPATSRPVEAPAMAAQPAARGGTIRLSYAPGAKALTESSRGQVGDIVRQLEANSAARVEIAAFASGTPERPSDARRLSLTRALEIRGFLIDSGIRSTRIDVRALGADAQGGPADRVDLNIKG